MEPSQQLLVVVTLRCGDLREQSAPATEEEATLLGQQDVSFTAAAKAELLPYVLERRTEL